MGPRLLVVLLVAASSLKALAQVDDDFAEFDDEEGEFDFDMPGNYSLQTLRRHFLSNRLHTVYKLIIQRRK
jgi:hypothetical protein